MRPRDLAALDFARVTARVSDFAASPAGRERCLALAPSRERNAADTALERAWQMFRLLEQHGDPPLASVADVRPHLRSAAHEGFVLDGPTLVQVRMTLAALRSVGAFFRRHVTSAPALADLPERLVAFPSLEAALTRALDDDGGVLDAASEALARVRANIRRLRDTLTRKLEELVGRRGLADVVADDYVTVRNNRFVVPVRVAAAAQLPGVVQDRSVSGETLFVEPLFAVEMNNALLLAVREEALIVQRILTDLTTLCGAEHDAISASIDALVEADALTAAARFARTYRCTRPQFSRGAVALRGARHPGLLFTGRPVTAIDLLIPQGTRVLVVTGPNTGGKTVALKTLGLCALMAQSGLLIPVAEGAQLPCVTAVYADVGDEQSIERNLSTFSAHVANLGEIAAAGVRDALVLLDEPGVGTDPEEGAALALGLIDWFDAHGAWLALTTHYTPVKLAALDDPLCAVAAVDFDLDTLTPRYRLAYDSIGRSLALPIARRLGLPEAILAIAEAAQPEHARVLSAALERLERTRDELARARDAAAAHAQTLAAQEAESTRLLAELRDRRRSAWQEELRSARAFVRQLKDEGRAKLEALRGAAGERAALDRYAREQLAAIAAREQPQAAPGAAAPPTLPGRVQIGDMVEVVERGIQGELLQLDGARAWIQRGALRFEVPAEQLRRIGSAAPARAQVTATPAPSESGTGELSLIGLRAGEAIDKLASFLDRAVRAGEEHVRIIHGVGSGALRRAVQDYLATSPYCAGYRGGAANEGGGGVTVATLLG